MGPNRAPVQDRHCPVHVRMSGCLVGGAFRWGPLFTNSAPGLCSCVLSRWDIYDHGHGGRCPREVTQRGPSNVPKIHFVYSVA